MTKIKNTKKGMAKKTLSISLAVAMLATSNVPVWAAEFTDGTDAAFTSEAVVETPVEEVVTDAPVVEEEVAPEVEASNVVEAGDLVLDELTVTKETTFEVGSVAVSGKIKIKRNGNIEDLNNFKYGWRVKGSEQNIFTDEVFDGNVGNMSLEQVGFGATEPGERDVDWSPYVGKVLQLVVFNNEKEDETKINPTVVGETVIQKRDLTGSTLRINKEDDVANGLYEIVYNGKGYRYTETSVDGNSVTLNPDGNALTVSNTEKWDAARVLKFFDVDSNTALNAGEKLVVRATAKTDSPYKGTVKAAAVTVQKKDYAEGDLAVTLNESIFYPYTGSTIKVDASKITLKESDKLSGKTISGAILNAETQGYKVGMLPVNAFLNHSVLSNYNFAAGEGVLLTTPDDVEANRVNVTQRNLSTQTNITIAHGGRILVNTSVADFIKNDLKLTDKDGTALNLAEGKTGDYVVSVFDADGKVVTDKFANSGKLYKIFVTAVEKADFKKQNCVEGQELTVYVTDNIISDVTTQRAFKPAYTGEEIRPTKADFGTLTIKGVDGVDVPLQSDQWEFTGKYVNNTNATTYEYGKIKDQAFAEIKVLGDNGYKGQTALVPFEILPLTVSESTVTVPSTVTYNQGYGAASDYNVQLVVTAKDATGKIVKGLTAEDYSVEYEYVNGSKSATNAPTNELHDFIKATITVKNPNFMGEDGEVVKIAMNSTTKHTEIVEKALTSSMIKFNPATYTYTGGVIIPTYAVMDGELVLWDEAEYGEKGEYKVESIVNNKNVGKATLTIAGIPGQYYGKASADFEITPANTDDVKVTFTIADEMKYTGRQVRPRTFTAKLNGNTVTDQFEIVGYGKNISGKGTVELKPVDGNKNFTGKNITAEFNIVKEFVTGDLHTYNKNGEDVTTSYKHNEKNNTLATNQKYFEFDGTAKEFASTLLKDLQKSDKDGTAEGSTKASASDFEVKYVDNVSGKKGFKFNDDNYNIGYVYVVAKDGSGYAGTKEFTTADGTTIKGVVDYIPFLIKNVKFVKENVSVKNGAYAGGLPVKPEVLVQINGNTLVEGKDYTLEFVKKEKENGKDVPVTPVDVTDGDIYRVIVTGINGYEGSVDDTHTWGVDKKDLKDCDIKVVNGVAYVMNGYIPVPVTEYTVKDNGDKTYTVTANAASKNYTGSKTVVAEGQKPTDKPETPMIQSVKVVGNKATVILSGETEGAVGYDYVISTDKDCINNKDYDKVNKNILNTTTDFTYVGQDVYYAYCHAWKRGEDGKKIFSDWSNAYPFVVSAITPSQPAITSVKVKGSTVTVTYTKSSNADGYDVVLGSKVATVAGEKRPVEYGTLVKKNIKGNTVTATFKNVKKGTYYAGLHAFNRTSEDGKKVFSPWSNVKKVTVK